MRRRRTASAGGKRLAANNEQRSFGPPQRSGCRLDPGGADGGAAGLDTGRRGLRFPRTAAGDDGRCRSAARSESAAFAGGLAVPVATIGSS